mgnify:CR=1 FL=1
MTAQEEKEDMLQIGTLITFKIPGLYGRRTVAGTIKRILPDGRIEVKAQLGGYYIITNGGCEDEIRSH